MSEKVLRIRCPNLSCGRILAVPTTARGKRVKCRKCGTIVIVPQKKTPTAPTTGEAGAEVE